VFDKINQVLSLTVAPIADGIQVDTAEQRDPTVLFDLSGIRKFAGDNPETFAMIIKSFVQQSQEDMATLESYAQKRDWQAAAEMAHKMLTSYGHFGVHNAMESLLMLDKQRSGNIDQKASAEAVKQIRSILNDLIPVLEIETGN